MPRRTERDEHVVETPSGRRVDTSRLVLGVGYVDEDGAPLSDEDRAYVAKELAERAARASRSAEKT